MRIRKTGKGLRAFGYVYISILVTVCLIPFWLILSASFTDQDSLMLEGYGFWPAAFSTAAYNAIFAYPETIIRAYGVTILITGIGTLLGLFITAMAGYVLQRQDYIYRNKVSFFFYFTVLFSGGLIPWYIMIVEYLNWKDAYVALLFPFMLSPFNIILIRSFMRSIPDSISESAKIDGAGDFTIFLKLIMPLAKPGLATVGLFMALMYWNDWFLGSLFLESKEKYPLQLLLFNMLTRADIMTSGMVGSSGPSVQIDIPTETLKMATAVIATGPIIFLYPFVQRYFVKGLTIGAVKG